MESYPNLFYAFYLSDEMITLLYRISITAGLMGCFQSSLGTNDPQGGLDKHPSLFKTPSQSNDVLTLFSLNYCGIMNSPFQFYCEDVEQQLVQLSSIFVETIPKYVQGWKNEKGFKWDMAKIDVKIRKERLAPAYREGVGIENGKFMTRQRFQQVWEEEFKKGSIQCKYTQYTQAQKNTVKAFDLICFHSLLKFIFPSIQTINDAQNKSVQTYTKFYSKFFALSFLDEKRKLQRIINSINLLHPDVLFFSQPSPKFIEEIQRKQTYFISIHESKDTMVLASKKIFKQQKDYKKILSADQIKELDINQSASIIIVDNFLILSYHLSSKEEKNLTQVNKLKEILIATRAKHPQFQILAGGDLNSFMAPLPDPFFSYPASSMVLTTIKKRTMFQAQFNKGNQLVCESKDKIISTLPIKSAMIANLVGERANFHGFLPSDEHPCDHFVVSAKISKKV